jgi:hypothetical protein
MSLPFAKANRPKLRIFYFSTWLQELVAAKLHLKDIPTLDLSTRVTNPNDPELLRLARLDSTWDAECLRCFARMQHPELEFLSPFITGPLGLIPLLKNAPTSDTNWLIFTGQRPSSVDSSVRRVLELFTQGGSKVLYWSFDEASRNMSCFATEVAPYLSILIHDEFPLADHVQMALPKTCLSVHRSWSANIIPFSYPFVEDVEKKIVFLGSKLGFTTHRKEQVEALQKYFKDRFQAIYDHSVPVTERGNFGKIKVHFCPEGRMFHTEGMRFSHTDRPFWSGCLGQIPVVEDSKWGGRLDDLFQKKLIQRYPHGDIKSLIEQCENALEASDERRREIYTYFNEFETIGSVAADLIAKHTLSSDK